MSPEKLFPRTELDSNSVAKIALVVNSKWPPSTLVWLTRNSEKLPAGLLSTESTAIR